MFNLYLPPMNLSNSMCVVTGGTTGIGYATAAALSVRGATVAICGRSEDGVRTALKRLKKGGADVVGWTCDVSDESSVAEFADRVRSQGKPVDVLVNNAGVGHFARLGELALEQIDETWATNVRGVFLMTQAFLPEMIERGVGHIVNVASLAGRNGVVGGTAYAASKHAVLGFSRSLMLEVRAQGVRVIAVCPGSVDTPFFAKAGVQRDDLDRVLTADDVASTILSALDLPDRALVSELDVRPANP
jgi:3-oxoacyl-[acyl-carrier protein] reductase